MGEPMVYNRQTINTSPIAVMGAISVQRGKVHFKLVPRSFNSEGVIEFLTEVLAHAEERYIYPSRLCIFWDNAGIHRSRAVQEFLTLKNIKDIKNLPYRPDLNPIERYWAQAKQNFKKEVGKVVLTQPCVDNLTMNNLVIQSLHAISDKFASDLSLGGFKILRQALPRQPNGKKLTQD